MGRPSIDSVVLIKTTCIRSIFGIRFMRQTINGIETNMAYRWFLSFGFHTEVPLFLILAL
ncbi:transposase [Bacillus sp. FJAT-49731]|nr:transposase [Lederbergia citrea]